jgi:osmotically-inducible protein OsmY
MAITPVTDRSIIKNVTNRLAGRGVRAPCKVAVEVRNGQVTLTGSVQHAYQKGAAVQAATMVSGVRRVIDQLVVKAVTKF